MVHKKGKILFAFGLGCLILLLAGCDNNEKTIVNNYYLSLSGESDNWKLNSYEMVIKPNTFEAGNGSLSMKGKTEYTTDFFSYEIHAVIDDKDRVVQMKSVKGSESDISKTSIGVMEGETFFDENGEPISIEDIGEIYMIIEWQYKNRTMKEKMNLLTQESLFH